MKNAPLEVQCNFPKLTCMTSGIHYSTKFASIIYEKCWEMSNFLYTLLGPSTGGQYGTAVKKIATMQESTMPFPCHQQV